jgi:hypothetical protein
MDVKAEKGATPTSRNCQTAAYTDTDKGQQQQKGKRKR